MPIRHLDIYLDEKQLVQSSPIQNLRGWRIGIEGNQWLKRLFRSAKGSSGVKLDIESGLIHSIAMGGTIPDSLLEDLIVSELENFRRHEMRPVFVFNGLPIPRHERPFSTEDNRPAKRNSAWNAYSEGREGLARSLWQASSSILHAEYVSFVISLLEKHGAEYLRAPYAAWAQLAYMESQPRPFVHGILCGSETLLWPVSQIILNFDWDMQLFYWVSRISVLQSMGLATHDQFIETCLLAGFDWIPTFSGLLDSVNESRQIFTFKSAVDMVRAHQSGLAAIKSRGVNDKSVVKTYFRVKCAVRYHPVLALDGLVRPFLLDNGCPTDLQFVFGPKLPDLAYLWIAQGIVSPQVFSAITLGLLPEFAPLDSTQSPEYRMYLTGRLVQGMRSQALSSITGLLSLGNDYDSAPVVHTVLWFDPKADVLIPNDPKQGMASLSSELSWLSTDLLNGMRKKKGSFPSLQSVFASLSKSIQRVQEGLLSVAAPDSPLTPNNSSEIVAVSFVQFLYMRKFTCEKASRFTTFGSAFERYFTMGKSQARFPEEMLILLELLKEPHTLTETYQDCPDKLSPEVRLISRIVSLLPLHLSSGSLWNGPFNRPLLVFYSFVRPVYRGLRILFETSLLTVLLTQHDTPSKTQILLGANENLAHEIIKAMPFSHDRSVSLGIAMQLLLLSKHDSEAQKMLTNVKANCSNLERDLANAVLFFKDFVELVKTIDLPELAYTKTQFQSASEYLDSAVSLPLQI